MKDTAADPIRTITRIKNHRLAKAREEMGLTQKAMASAHGAGAPVGKERVRQIEQRALRKLKHPARSRHLRSFARAEPVDKEILDRWGDIYKKE